MQEYTLDYLLNYCEDSNIPITDVRVIVENEELLTDLEAYKKQVLESVINNGVGL